MTDYSAAAAWLAESRARGDAAIAAYRAEKARRPAATADHLAEAKAALERIQARDAERGKGGRPKFHGSRETKQCPCGGIFRRRPSESPSAFEMRRFCRSDCPAKPKAQPRAARPRGPRVEQPVKRCDHCGARMTKPVNTSYREWAKRKYCGKACQYATHGPKMRAALTGRRKPRNGIEKAQARKAS